jgi:hypothetical protein
VATSRSTSTGRAKKKTKAEEAAEANAALKAHIRETLKDWAPGKWANDVGYGPACHCGVAGAKEPCTRHGEIQQSRPRQADGDTAAAG